MTVFNKYPLSDPRKGINVDLFAGGGGASLGTEMGSGRSVHIAINHNDDAISMHKANHPQTKHYISDVYDVCPIEACEGHPVEHLHASPDCTHHSQAMGSQPRKKATRSLSWVVLKWAGKKKPKTITLENVEQILKWSPLVAKRCPKTGRVVKLDRTVAAKGERVPVEQQFLVPDEKRRGRNWNHFVEGFRAMGYQVQWRVLPASWFGAHTTRKRLYMIARCDGMPILWPKQEYSQKPTGNLKKEKAMGECIDWSISGQSIFGRKKDLAEATLKRIAAGVGKFVLNCESPYIAPVGAAAFITEHANASSQRNMSMGEPLRTICANVKGGHFAMVTAYLARHFGTGIGRELDRPMPTIMCSEKTSLVEVELAADNDPRALRCTAFILQYYSSGGQWGDLNKPMNAITTRDRMALVTVWLMGDPYVIVDIRMRMLTPRELYRAQGFPDSYIIDRGHDGRVFSKQKQVLFVGNSVSPIPQARIVECLDLDFYKTTDFKLARV